MTATENAASRNARVDHLLDRLVDDVVGAEFLGDLLVRAAARDELALGRHVDAVGAGVEQRRLAPRTLAPILLMWGLSVVILIWQRDLGTAILFFLVFLTLLYVASG